jgi:hypothetical protein
MDEIEQEKSPPSPQKNEKILFGGYSIFMTSYPDYHQRTKVYPEFL